MASINLSDLTLPLFFLIISYDEISILFKELSAIFKYYRSVFYYS